MDMYRMFETSPDVERKGVCINYGTFRVWIARAGGANKKYQKAMNKAFAPYTRALKNETMDEQLADDLWRGVYAETVVLDWDTFVDGEWKTGILQRDGSIAPVTKESISLVLKELPDLFEDLREQAGKSALFRAATMELAKGNL